MGRKIVTRYDPKPIPLRRFDWVAIFDDYDPTPVDANTPSQCPIGFGPTEAQATTDLLETAVWMEG